MTKITDKGRNQLLATVGTAMAASMMVTSAHAADTVVTPAGLPTVTTSVQGHDVVDAVLANVDDILSQIDGVSGGVDQTVSPGGTSTIVVDENIVRAAALGNNFDNSIDLSIIGNDVDGDGAAALGFEYNDGAITATATNVDIFANLDDFTGGAVGVDSNSVKAEATGNAGSTSLAGSIPNTYVTSAPSGVSHFDSAGTPELLNASGSLVASTVQMNADVDIDSYVEADIYLDLVSTGDQSVAGSPEVIGNTSAATSKGNSSNSTIDIQSGGAPTFEGSAVVSNGQSNVGVAGQDSHIEAENYTYIYGDIGAEAGFTNTLTGSLLVQNNSISASASGNEALGATTGAAGNRILLADGMSFQGATDNSASTDIVYTSGTVDSNVAADLVINNSQGNVGAANGDRLEVYGYNDESEIYGEAQELVGGSIDVSGNSITASARGNAASSALSSGEGAATFAGTVAVANQQTNLYTDVLAEVYDSYIWGWAGDDLDNLLTDSTISVDDNRFAASAYGNQVSQNVTLDANTLDFGSGALVLTGGTGPDGNLSSDGGVIVSNLQSLYSSNVTADEESYIEIGTYSALIDNSTLQATGNTQEAVALGNTGSNGLSISGTTVDSNAGINSVQIVADASAISAVSNSEVDLESLQVNGSTVEMSGNLNRAIAYGASVSNNLAVDANEIILSDNDIGSTVTFNPIALDGFVLDNTNAPTVLAPYGVLNIQSVSASISAQASSDTPFELDIDQSLGGEDEGSTAINDSNTLVAAAYGTDSFNRASLTANTVDTPSEPLPEGGEYSAVMNLTNAQTVTNNSIISAEASGSRIVETDITLGAGNVIESTSSASSNNVQALAYGNLADNGVSGSATTLDTEASFFGLGSRGAAVVTNGVTLADASFGLNNVQSAGGVISAALLDTVNQEDAALVLTAVGNDVVASSIISDDNSLAASATGNRATNAIALDGNELATTSALVNFQNSGANITTAIGLAGTDAVAPTSGGTYPTSGLTGNATGGSSLNGLGILTVPTGETVTLSWSLTGAAETDLEAYLTTLGFSVNAGANTATGGPDTYDMSAFFGGNLAVGGALSFTGFSVPGTPGIPAEPNAGGVRVAIAGDLVASSISVDANSIAGSVTGNSASNSVKVDGNTVRDGSSYLLTSAGTDGLNTDAQSDHSLVNLQVVSGDTALTSNVFGTFAIDMPNEDSIITNSSLTVDGNSQSSRSVANTASNVLELSATNTGAGVALASNQASAASVSALSDVEIFAPVASNNTSVSMSNNTNLAVGVINDVSNKVTIDVTNSDHVADGGVFDTHALLQVDAIDDTVDAYGDNVLLNQQVAETSANAAAVTTIYNQDGTFLTTDGISNGSVTISGNSTTAEASANRATNVMTASASASMGANAGVVNAQVSEAAVTSSATTTAGVTLAGDAINTDAALDGGSVTLGSNTTSALARGNAATNVLNYSAGANYGTPGGQFTVGASNTGLDGAVADARSAVLNVQYNNGAVSASSTSASYVVALNSDASPAVGITNATVGVIGNSVSAAAYGNTATNTLTQAALNTGMPSAAVANVQFNSAPVTASVTTVSYGITSGVGAVSGSALSVTSNAVTATAVGNNAVNAIVGN